MFTQRIIKLFTQRTLRPLVIAIFLVNIPASDVDVNVNRDANVSAGVCDNPAPVNALAASLYTAMIVGHDPNVVDSLTINGGEAGMIGYNEVKKVLEANHQCYADEDAFTAGRALASAGLVTLPLYFNKAAYTVASSLFQLGVLDCSNAVALSLEYYGYVQHHMRGMDDKEFGSYVHGIVYGWVDMVLAHGKTLLETKNKVVNLFYKSFQEDKKIKTTCKFNSTSS